MNSEGFDRFWARQVRKVAKKDAMRAWEKFHVTPELEAKIHAALDWQLPIFETRDPEAVPHPSRWLNAERWEDEQPAAAKPKASAPSGEEVSRFQAMRALRVSR